MRTWILPKTLLASSIEIMAPYGRLGSEGLALWLGREETGDGVRATHVLNVHGPGFISGPQQLHLSDRAMSRITDVAADLNTFLIGQIHSHPGTFIQLSQVDVVHGIRIEGYLSLVCPHYAQKLNTAWGDCGFHVFEGADYRQLHSREIASRVYFDPNPAQLIALEVPA